MRKLLASSCVVLATLGLTALRAQQPKEPAERPLDPDAVAVRLLLGVGDDDAVDWSGRVRIDRGEVLGVEGWRFRAGDKVVSATEWEAKSLRIRKNLTKKAAAKVAAKTGRATGPGTAGGEFTPTGVIVTVKAPEDATLTVDTAQGEFRLKLADLADAAPRRALKGRVEARRVPVVATLAAGPNAQDFPAAAAGPDGGLWVAYVEHEPLGPEVSEALTEPPKRFDDLIPKGGGDRIKLVRVAPGRPAATLDVTPGGLDVWRPAVAVGKGGKVEVAWLQFVQENWELYRRTYDPDRDSWSDAQRLTNDPGPDAAVALAAAPDGRVWVAWQGWRGGQADIWLAPLDRMGDAVNVSDTPANEWTPALAIDSGGRIHVAYDSYNAGNYDVMLRSRSADGTLGEPVAVAATPKFEARPSVAVGSGDKVFIAYEERDANWGKDAENLVEGKGSSLYRSGVIRAKAVEGDRVTDLPPVPTPAAGRRPLDGFARLVVSGDRPWLLFRHRLEAIWGNNAVMVVGGVWLSYATMLADGGWTPPQPLSRSDGLLDNRPALVPLGEGRVLAFHNTDGRLRREVESTPELQRKYYTHSGTPPGVVDNDLMVSVLTPPRTAAKPPAAEPEGDEEDDKEPPAVAAEPVHPDEAADVARMRRYRIKAGGKTYQLLRGEFHRHSEISQDGGSDGALEDMWRYAIDVAAFDWIGNGDHDNGGGKEYTWWLVQKTTDLYRVPSVFTPMFTYERSVGYPGGHRNVMFPMRGVRTLPRLVGERGVQTDVNGRDLDAAMLYAYLNQLGGITAAHTTGTGMGTDWRQNDPKVEPFVEIFQGHRNSYEHLGAPRVARRPGEAIGGWKPLGMVWNALALQYRLGFQASSDHISTHISYAVAIAEEPTRASIFDAFRRRHCYAATDNILLDVRSGDHLMGDEFDADGPVRLKVIAHGTRPIAKVDVIKDFRYVYSTEPGSPTVEFTWTDDERRPPGLSWYYVRVEQDDGQLAWASPIWVHTRK